MKERPILMRGPLVCATPEDRKWKTRRVITPQFAKLWGQGVRHGEDTYSAHVDIPADDGWKWIRCPYGRIGDRLWVRETFARLWFNGDDGWQTIYRADDNLDCIRDAAAGQWKPSIHMPRALSRLTLEITDIQVERVQDITPRDVVAEGLYHEPGEWGPDEAYDHLIRAFAALWDTINAKRGYGWAVNPWVWVLSYKRVRP